MWYAFIPVHACTTTFRVRRIAAVQYTCVAEGVMTSPEMENTGNAGYGTGSSGTRQGAGEGTGHAGQMDDVSFARNMGVDEASEKIKEVAQRGLSSAEDAMSQLQQKAGELTSNLIDRVNVDELTQKLEQQVRDHPTRTLMMAAGAGFLLGRLVKK